MKYAKLALVMAVLLAIIAGVVVISTTKKADEAIAIPPSTEKEEIILKDIYDKITNAPDNQFCVKAYEEIQKKINLFFKDEPSKKTKFMYELQYAYTDKFILQAMYVFDRNEWKSSDISTIRREYKRCKVFSKDNTDLNKIYSILVEYDKLLKFNSEVSQVCNTRSKCLTDASYLYREEDWDVAKANDLLNHIPSANTKAQNSPAYTNTRRSKVEQRLKSAHKKFIEEKMDCAEQEAIGYNYNPSRHQDWELMVSKLYVNFRTYNNRWSENVSAWQKRAAEWERYTISQTNTL